MLITRRDMTMGAGAALLLPACSTFAEPGAQARADLYNCEGCEAALERPAASLTSRLMLASRAEPGERMLLTGRVVLRDSHMPALGVVVYAHQTNAAGRYAGGLGGNLWSRRHGRLRGWVKTDADGRYAFDTIKPAPYPDRTMPAHVHLYIAEPGRRPYYVDDVVFAGEFGVTPAYRVRQELRGGSGIVACVRSGGVWRVRRDIMLESHPG